MLYIFKVLLMYLIYWLLNFSIKKIKINLKVGFQKNELFLCLRRKRKCMSNFFFQVERNFFLSIEHNVHFSCFPNGFFGWLIFDGRLTGSYLAVCGTGKARRVQRCWLTHVGCGLVVMVVVMVRVVRVVRRRHSHGTSPQMLQFRQPLGEGQGSWFDFIHLLTMTCRGAGGVYKCW